MGSNIDAEKNLRAAGVMLRERWPGVRFSSVYRSAPTERSDQADFLNAVAVFEARESPETTHTHLLSIEKALKKNPPFRYGPRTIDLDLLLFGKRIIETPALQIPHPKIHQRRFVLEPLQEISGGTFSLPLHNATVGSFLKAMQDQACVKTEHTL